MGEEEVGRCGEEVREDLPVAVGAGFDYGAGEEVGVDYGERVRGGGEHAGYGGFAGCEGAR